MNVDWNVFRDLEFDVRLHLLETFMAMVPGTFSQPFDVFAYEAKVTNLANIGLLEFQNDWVGISVSYSNDSDQGVGFVSLFSIESAFRKLGLGKFLMNETLKLLIANGMNKAKLEVDSSNLDAIQFYKASGFVLDKYCESSMLLVKSLN